MGSVKVSKDSKLKPPKSFSSKCSLGISESMCQDLLRLKAGTFESACETDVAGLIQALVVFYFIVIALVYASPSLPCLELW